MHGKEYSDDLPKKIYLFFLTYDDDASAPSMAKFARSVGVTEEEIESYREHEAFDRAYRECMEIRRDYLIDRALCKRFDPSFVKYLLDGDKAAHADDSLSLKLEVLP